MTPRGFIELTCVPSGTVWHVRVESIAAYGPDQRDGPEMFVGCPVQLRGQPANEARLVASTTLQIARLCILSENVECMNQTRSQ
jgi:hypothetical protein